MERFLSVPCSGGTLVRIGGHREPPAALVVHAPPACGAAAAAAMPPPPLLPPPPLAPGRSLARLVRLSPLSSCLCAARNVLLRNASSKRRVAVATSKQMLSHILCRRSALPKVRLDPHFCLIVRSAEGASRDEE